jgi:DNA polymerase/3'-5' exonuclease PolX
MSDKKKFPREIAAKVFEELRARLADCCLPDYIAAAGSYRRLKPLVGDLEILYAPRFGPAADGELFAVEKNLFDVRLSVLEFDRILARRHNVNGSEMFGEKNKLMVHVATGLPVDLFATTPESWMNYLVCRTGGAESNKQIATRAKAQGYTWNPYGPGFTRLCDGKCFVMQSEKAVFEFVGLPYLEPHERP